MKRCIVICGQTASGKSSLAVKIALYLKNKGYDAEIISADSRQVYIGADTISAKITEKEMNGIKHHMISVTNFKKDYTVADYKKNATKILKGIIKKGSIPIICGGTGFYIDNLVYKKTIPETLPNPKLRTYLEKLSLNELNELLLKKDPKRFKTIDTKNKRRIIRALEIIEDLGYVPDMIKPELIYETLFIGLYLDKEKLESVVDNRTNKRMKLGMLNEINKIKEINKISYERIQSLGMEFKWLTLLLQKQITKEECIVGIKKDTLEYARRQMTWFKKNKNVIWLNNQDKTKTLKEAKHLVLGFLSK